MFRSITIAFLTVLAALAKAQPGTLDYTFDPQGGPDARVGCMALQSDGKILIGGEFTHYNGVVRNRIARLNSDGTLDPSFNPGSGANDRVNSIAVQSNGKILIAGVFTTVNGTSRRRIARLNSSGSLDTSFDPGTAFDDIVSSILIQSDGKILVCGGFSSFNGTPRLHAARLNSDGSMDSVYNTAGTNGANTSVSCLGLQSNGKVIIGGNFSSFDGQAVGRLARTSIAALFDLSFNSITGADDAVARILVRPDDKIYIVGAFSHYNGTSRNHVARLNVNGTLDTGFNPGSGSNGTIGSVALRPDGKVIIGGYFTSYNGVQRNGIALLEADGSLNTTFDPGEGTTPGVLCLLRQPDGRILIGGDFTTYDGVTRTRLARIHDDDYAGVPIDVESSLGMRLYPDPADDRLLVQVAVVGMVDYVVRDASGAACMRGSYLADPTTGHALGLTGLTAGVYQLETSSPQGRIVARFVKY